jgi:pyruvate/2-oxoglutarate dehydrogenase complex dihydrolipoamide acyltransferase (E2) component
VDSGYLCEILVPEGTVAPVGTVIAVLAEKKEEC